MFFSATIRWYAYDFSMYFTPKSSTTREKEIGLVICCHIPGVCVTSKYPCGARFSFRPLFASACACRSLYMDHLISLYTYPFLAFYLKLYCCMICSENTDTGISMYSYRSKRVQS